jgi:hypothetical protein
MASNRYAPMENRPDRFLRMKAFMALACCSMRNCPHGHPATAKTVLSFVELSTARSTIRTVHPLPVFAPVLPVVLRSPSVSPAQR